MSKKLNKEKYFSHDYGASNDIKIQLMTNDLGMEGYGIYWYIVEQLANNEGYLPMSFIPIIAKKANVEEIKVRGVIESYDLFIIGDGKFYTQRLLDHLDKRKELQEAGKRGAAKRWNNSQIADNQYQNRGGNGVAIANPIASKGKESKIKDDDVDRSYSPTSHLWEELTLDECAKKYFETQQLAVESTMRLLGLKSSELETYKNIVWAFVEKKKAEGEEAKTLKDFSSHVSRWANHHSVNWREEVSKLKKRF